MDQAVEAFTVMLMISNGVFSYKGFTSRGFYEKHLFWVRKITEGGESFRIISSGFLHANWAHLIFNMLALYSFSVGVGRAVGLVKFIIIYFASLTGGNLLALFFNRDNPDYRAVGASGAVCGVIFASILYFPDSSIYILFLPIAIPSWLFGIGFILISIYGIKSRFGNLGHEAHLGGAIIGIAVSVLFNPALLTHRLSLIIMLVVPISVFLYLLVRHPSVLGGRRR